MLAENKDLAAEEEARRLEAEEQMRKEKEQAAQRKKEAEAKRLREQKEAAERQKKEDMERRKKESSKHKQVVPSDADNKYNFDGKAQAAEIVDNDKGFREVDIYEGGEEGEEDAEVNLKP
jgi:colicin import membrane protein